jgi:multiple sugar transport system ATP-binding protein
VAELRLDGVSKRYPGAAVAALQPVDLTVADGEFVTILGPSGCGKTTLLNITVGIVPPTTGRVLLDGRDITYADPRDRDMAMVFQNFALYPSKTVRANLEIPLRMRGVAPHERQRLVEEVAATLGLTPLLNQRPRQLSGGQQQRVALGRALIRRPRLFLMDEPLSNLDAKLRVQMRAEIKRLHRQFPITTIYVTHDQSEAMTLSDRVVVMNHGVIVQVGRPAEIYERPINRFVADFVGLPAMNFLPVTLRAADRAVECVLETGCVAARVGLDEPSVPVAATLGVRPSRVRWSPAAVDDAGVRAIVREVDVQGEETLIYAQVGASALTILEREGRLPAVGDELTITLPSEAIYLFDPESGRILALRDQTPVVSSQGTAPALVSRAP